MDLDALYALLALGAASPYVAEAAINWVQRSSRGKSLSAFFHSHPSHDAR